MPRLFLPALLLAAITLFIACDKDPDADPEAVFYGTWVKGSNPGDTLFFYQRDGKSYIRYNQSFNLAFYHPADEEFRYRNGKFYIKNAWGAGDFFLLDSFTWLTPGRKFEIQGSQLYMIMSSTLVRFAYHKVL